MERSTGYADLDGQRIAYAIVGDGPIDFVTNTGWLSPFDVEWDDPHARAFYQQWARFARIVRFDRRGVGASDPIALDALPPWESLSDEIEAVMDAASSERAVIVAGGTAAPAAALFAGSRKERVLGLVLFQATVRLLKDEGYPFGLSEDEHAQMLEFLGQAWGTGGMIDQLFPSRVGDPDFKEYLAKQERATSSPAVIKRYMEADATSDGRALLPMITAPTLVLHRTDSPGLSIEHGRYVADHITNAKLIEVPGGDVAPFYEYPDLILTAMEDFASAIRPVTEHERQLSTVLFTDIVGSTHKAEELGDRRWRALLEKHDEITKQAVANQLGSWIGSTGDGSVATFPGPGRAIVAASNVRDGIGNIDLHVRIGIHTGEIEIRENDIAGIAVHLAARVMAEAQPDEILVSRTVKDLVVGSELNFQDRGTHTLKGIDDPWQLYAVTT